jgi:hypothetical protein
VATATLVPARNPDAAFAPCKSAPLSGRIREIGSESHGEHGGSVPADSLGIPARTWTNYEAGVAVPAEILLALIEITRVPPHRPPTGEGDKSSEV